jgi:hypothetical protein
VLFHTFRKLSVARTHKTMMAAQSSNALIASSPAPLEKYTQHEIVQAERNLPKLFDLMKADDEVFDAMLAKVPGGQRALVHDVLGVPNKKLHSDNATMRVTTMRENFRAHEGMLQIQGVGVAEHLLLGKVFCGHCKNSSARAGLVLKKSIIKAHADTCDQYKAYLQGKRGPAGASSRAPTQMTLPATVEKQSAKEEPARVKRRLAVAYLEANGMAPHMIERVFGQSFMTVIKTLPASFGTASNMRVADTPAAGARRR